MLAFGRPTADPDDWYSSKMKHPCYLFRYNYEMLEPLAVFRIIAYINNTNDVSQMHLLQDKPKSIRNSGATQNIIYEILV